MKKKNKNKIIKDFFKNSEKLFMHMYFIFCVIGSMISFVMSLAVWGFMDAPIAILPALASLESVVIFSVILYKLK